MSTAPPASLADLRRIEQAPYAGFMPHATVHDALAASAARHADRWALTSVDEAASPALAVRRWTYAELLARVNQAANLFASRVPSSSPARLPRIALLLPPVPEAYVALWGAETAGIACPINHQLNAEHIAALVKACEADVLVAYGPCAELDIAQRLATVRAACPALRHVLVIEPVPGEGGVPAGTEAFTEALRAQPADRLAFERGDTADAALFHTGGTTGAPKMARHLQRNQLHAAAGAALMFGMTERDVLLNGFPIFHVAGAFVYGLSTLIAGAELVLAPRLGLRDTHFMRRYGEVVQAHGVTLLAVVPTVLASLLALDLDPARLRSVRAALTGGSPLPAELATAFEQRHGIPVRNILGMTESAGVISIEPVAGPRVAGSCGLPLPFTEVQAVRPDGRPAATGEPGVLRVRGPQVSPGYTETQRNAGTFEADDEAGGVWLVSGDIGHVDAEGRVFVTGRQKDVIIRGSHNIDPQLIESVLLRHPDVLMAAAVGQPDAHAGEVPMAFVSLKPGATVDPAALLAFATPHIAERPAVPKRIELLPQIPVTAVGKVYKPALRVLATQQTMDALLQGAGLAPRVAVQAREAAGGVALHFTLTDAADEPALRRLMTPFALPFTLTTGDGPAR